MSRIKIADVEALDFGINNFTEGMRAIVFRPYEVSLDKVKKLPGVFLNPIYKPNSLEIFALLGTQEQFEVFYKKAVRGVCLQKASHEIGGFPRITDKVSWEKLARIADRIEESFKPWYDDETRRKA